MKTLVDLKNSIEKVREELDNLVVSETFETYYEKSKELDKLIEAYIDMTV